MISIRALCDKYRRDHGIRALDGADGQGLRTDFADVVSIPLEAPQLVCVGARPGMGRMAFCIDMMLKTALTTDKKVIFFFGDTVFKGNLELLTDRLVRRLCGANYYSVIKNASSDELMTNTKRVAAALRVLERLSIYFDGGKNPTADYIREGIAEHKNVGLVIIGNIEFIVPDYDNVAIRRDAVKMMTERLSDIAAEMKVPIVMLTTLSRHLERRENKCPNIRDLKLRHIRRFSDTVILLYRDSYYTMRDDDSAEIMIPKRKNGRTLRTRLRFDRSIIGFCQR